MPLSFSLDTAEREVLSDLARRSIEISLSGNFTEVVLPEGVTEASHAVLFRRLGAFVTLKLQGQLRGCIGTIVSQVPLYVTVWNMAHAAAFQDPRFPALREGEWPFIDVDISVLDELTPCTNPDDIVIGRHGLLLQYRGYSGVFLPQVPVEQGWNRLEYLENLCRKAGLPIGVWKEADARLYWYEAFVFKA